MDEVRHPDRLVGQFGSLEVRTGRRRVPLVEHEIEHVEDHAHAVGSLGLGRHLERDAAGPDCLLGAADALRHGGLRHEERVGDLGGREAAHSPQGQRELRGRRENRVAAQEQQRQRIVMLGRPVLVGARRAGPVGGVQTRDRLFAPAPRPLAAHLVDQPAPRDADQPGVRVLRDTLGGPAGRGRQESLLDRVLACVEAVVLPGKGAEHPRRELAQQALDFGLGPHPSAPPVSMIGRTSRGQ